LTKPDNEKNDKEIPQKPAEDTAVPAETQALKESAAKEPVAQAPQAPAQHPPRESRQRRGPRQGSRGGRDRSSEGSEFIEKSSV